MQTDLNDELKDFGLEFVLTDIALKAVYGSMEKRIEEPEQEVGHDGA